jgi:hypothetical protein
MFALTRRAFCGDNGVSRCLLLALFVIWSAAPAAAGTIVGQFYFERDSGFCDPDDDSCRPFETFYLTNVVDESGLLAGLTYSALIQIDGIDYDDQFIDSTPIAPGGFANTTGLPLTPPFAGGGMASLVFTDGNFAAYSGTLSLSNLLYDDGSPEGFSADVVFSANAVTEARSWLVAVIGVCALAACRVFLA